MKTKLTFFLLIGSMQLMCAQSPSLVCYQAVATNTAGVELVSTEVAIRASILSGTTTGNVVYSEEHNVTTDQFGLFTLDIGSKATPSADLSKIAWGKNTYYLKIEMAIPKGSTYRTLGVSPLLSVPFTLFANKVDTSNFALKSINDKDSDPTNELQGLSFDQKTATLKLLLAKDTAANNNVVVQDADSDPTNELQQLQFDGVTGNLKITDAQGKSNSEVNIRTGLFSSVAASSTYPQGISGKYIFLKKKSTYTVPKGKIFYVTANGNAQGDLITAEVHGYNYSISSYPSCPVFSEGTTISNAILTGFEADTVNYITPVMIDLKRPYEVPAHKTLFIKTGFGIGNFTLIVDDELTSFYAVNSGSQIPTIAGGDNGATIKYSIGSPLILTGYLIDNF